MDSKENKKQEDMLQGLQPNIIVNHTQRNEEYN